MTDCSTTRKRRAAKQITRWYWMCADHGQVEACTRCLRNADRHGPPEAWSPSQSWSKPTVGADRRTCHDYMPGDPPRSS